MSAKTNNGTGPASGQDEIRDTVDFHAIADVWEDEPAREEGMRFKGVYHEGGYVIEKPFNTADEARFWVEAAIRGPRPPRLELRLAWADSTKVGLTYWPALIINDRVVRSDELHNRDAALAWIASVGDEFNIEYQDVGLPPEE
jgi:hypothetical protein